MLTTLSLPAFAQKFRWDIEWYNLVQGTDKNNDSLLVPDSRFESDFRLNTKYTWRNGTRFVVRPRLLGDFNQFKNTETNETKTTTTGEATLTEFYLEGDASKTVTLSAGLQNYQWGPAEFISPTNPFFHFNRSQRAYNYKEDGRFLLRMNWSPNSQWSVIAIGEPMNNGKPFWIYDQDFKPKGALKIERRGKNALNYFGGVLGTIDDSLPFFGEYFNFEMTEGFSVYADARHSMGSAQYEPVVANDGFFDLKYSKNDKDWNTLMVAGLRWEGRVDVRMEYIYNSYGLTKDMMFGALIATAPQNPRGALNLKRLAASGMELIGQDYGYFSLRVPDLFIQNNNLALRYLHSFMDQSGSVQLSWDIAIGDAWTLFADGSYSIGEKDQELSVLEKANGLIGLKWNL